MSTSLKIYCKPHKLCGFNILQFEGWNLFTEVNVCSRHHLLSAVGTGFNTVQMHQFRNTIFVAIIGVIFSKPQTIQTSNTCKHSTQARLWIFFSWIIFPTHHTLGQKQSIKQWNCCGLKELKCNTSSVASTTEPCNGRPSRCVFLEDLFESLKGQDWLDLDCLQQVIDSADNRYKTPINFQRNSCIDRLLISASTVEDLQGAQT